jgi:hypothetical protein
MEVAVLALEQELYGETQPTAGEVQAAIAALDRLVEPNHMGPSTGSERPNTLGSTVR